MRLTSLPILASAAILAGALVSCSGRKDADPQAQALYDGASEAFQARDYSRATLLLDSLQKTFPSELGLQREAMALRPKVIEQATLLKISTNDSLVATDRLCLEKLRPEMMWVKNPRMIEGYWVSKSAYNPDFMNTTGLQGRVSEIGEFYIVSSMNPSSLHHTAVSLSDGASSVRTPDVAYDGESNYRISGSEVITFSPAQSDTIGKFAYSHADIPLTLTFHGKSSKSVKLTRAQVKALSDAYAYSRATIEARDLEAQRRHLEATLQVARNQIARTSSDVSDTDAPSSEAQ